MSVNEIGREFYPTDKGFFHDVTWLHFIKGVKHRKPGWQFDVGSDMLLITLSTINTDDPSEVMIRTHNFKLPPLFLSYSEKALFVIQCIILVETHEARESFEVDGERLFVPEHGNMHDIYAAPSI